MGMTMRSLGWRWSRRICRRSWQLAWAQVISALADSRQPTDATQLLSADGALRMRTDSVADSFPSSPPQLAGGRWRVSWLSPFGKGGGCGVISASGTHGERWPPISITDHSLTAAAPTYASRPCSVPPSSSPPFAADPAMGWALALHGGAGDVPRTLPPESREPRLATLRRCLDIGTAALREGRTALDVVELVVHTHRPTPTRLFSDPSLPVWCRAAPGDSFLIPYMTWPGEGAGGLPALQRRPGLRAHLRRHRRDGGLRHGGRHPALRRRLRPLHRHQRRLPRQARHGEDAAHLPRLRRRRGLRQGTGFQLLFTSTAPSNTVDVCIIIQCRNRPSTKRNYRNQSRCLILFSASFRFVSFLFCQTLGVLVVA